MLNRCTIAFAAMMALVTAADLSAQPPAAVPPTVGAISKADREVALGILDNVSTGIQNYYYDPKMNGLDWNAVIGRARDKIAESNSLNEAITQVAVAVSTLNDSHTTFQPYRTYHLDFGFEYELIWNRCFVTRVRAGSDAEAKGLKPGVEILAINGTAPNRQNLWSIEYLDYVLNPQPEMQLQIRSTTGETQTIKLEAKLSNSTYWFYRSGGGARYDVIRHNENLRQWMRMRIVNIADVGILRFPWFFFDVESFYWLSGKTRNDKALIVDLRGNHGGAVETLKYFVGMFFDHDVKLFDRVERKKTAPEIAKSQHHIYFPGRVIVLVNSESASAAEIFARVMQLEKRGKVIGDQTSGSVMEATRLNFSSSGVGYGAEVTVANVIMTDGQSIEHRGVTPDEMLLVQPADLASGRDPVLAHAAAEAGATISPEDAGKLFPYEWPKE
jgi:carboxyl-terminal processing protease